MRKLLIRVLALVCSLVVAPAMAENSTKVDGYTIHHNSLTTDFLTPENSHRYRIPRSRNRGMLNISVIKDEAGTTGIATPARVRAYSINHLGQQRPIPLREIREDDAIYYIGDFLVHHGERLDFDIEVQPEGSTQTYTTQMSQEFFTHY